MNERDLAFTLPIGVESKTANVAAVTVNATIPPLPSRQQSTLTVRAIGNANLRGGVRVIDPLTEGADATCMRLRKYRLV